MAPPVRQHLIPGLTPDQHSQAAEAMATVVDRLAQYRSTGERERLDSALDEMRLLRDTVNAWTWETNLRRVCRNVDGSPLERAEASDDPSRHFCLGCERAFSGDECPRCGSVCP